jgi:hypothetical protein
MYVCCLLIKIRSKFQGKKLSENFSVEIKFHKIDPCWNFSAEVKFHKIHPL